MSGIFTYDADGNFLTLSRSYNGDGFNYEYYTGTNRLKKVTGESDQFIYDYNGNFTNDYFNNNTDIKYDHRNLITEITRINELEDPPATYTTTYKYDEAGNRINKKVVKDDGSTMEIIVNEYYIRDLSGKEIAIYQNDTLKFWNVWGLGNEGRITAEGIRYYYIKDHLGSIRAVLNDNNDLVEAIDYDPWGHIARYWTTSPTKYKFTGKERDNETGYDYFGARYYDARIGRWGQEDLLINKYPAFSPYCYSLNSPILLKDPDGRWIPEYDENTNKITVRPEEGDDLQSLVSQIGISSEKFVQDQMALGINNFEINIGETVFDITNYVIANTNFDESYSGSNCHGFVLFAIGKSEQEEQKEGYYMKEILTNITENPRTGDIGVFEISESFNFGGRIVPKGEPAHSGIYILRDNSGNIYFLNRLNTGEKVSIKTQSEINLYYKDVVKKYKDIGIETNINENPLFYYLK